MQYVEESVSNNVRVNNWLLFLILSLLSITTVLMVNDILITDDHYFNLFGDQLAYDRVLELVEASKNWRWLGYSLLPFYLLFKFVLISMCLSVGTLLAGFKLEFSRLFRIVMISELIFFIPLLIKILWFGLLFTDYTMQDLQLFAPLSLVSLIGYESVEYWLVYPLQTISVFELLYWVLLAYGLTSATGIRFNKMIRLVSFSYGIGLLLWITFVMFLAVSMNE